MYNFGHPEKKSKNILFGESDLYSKMWKQLMKVVKKVNLREEKRKRKMRKFHILYQLELRNVSQMAIYPY